MSIFNLFSKKPSVSGMDQSFPISEKIGESNQAPAPPFDLFIDSEPPKNEPVIQVPQNQVSAFLSKNYLNMGVNDGFEYHSNETLEIGKRKIVSEFQLLMDQEIDKMQQKRLQMRTLRVTVAQISEESKLNLDLTIEELNSSLLKLETQKNLSAEHEGWVMNAVHSYHQGFVQGLNDYISAEHFMSATNLFNS